MAFLPAVTSPTPARADSFTSAFFASDGWTSEFAVRGSNGYVVQIEGSRDQVTLTARNHSSDASYEVAGLASPREVVASFGSLGRVEVEFKPGQRVRIETPPRRCTGKPHVTRWGVFVGTIRFVGEHGYTRLRTGRAPGITRRWPHWSCRPHHGGRGGGPPRGSGDSGEAPVIFEDANPRAGLEVTAFTFRPPEEQGATLFLATLSERRKRMHVRRQVFIFARERAFSFDESLSTATLAPPAPFTGTATFERQPDGSVTWAGSLSVALPGTTRISLVGPRSHPRLYRLGEDGVAKPGI